jgi:hypothetical protein
MATTLHGAPADVFRTAAPATARRLRTVLLANAATSAAAGVAAVVAGTAIGELIGADPTEVRIVGAGLVAFALAVAMVATRAADDRLPGWAFEVTAADVSWVLATAVVLAVADLTTAGRWIAVVLAVVVADFAVTQAWLASRVRSARRPG